MAENVQQSVEVPVGLALFGSLVTEMDPVDLPEGISPDNQDVVYLPGGVGSRSGMRKWVPGLPANVTITYEKSFVKPDGITLNLFVTSDGGFWIQNAANPLGIGKIADVTPGSYANSVSAFGKELITFHDGVHGTDIPRIFDGAHFDRATQDGPAAPPQIQNLALGVTNLAPDLSGHTLTRLNNIVTGQTTAAHALRVGYAALISGVDASALGGGIASVVVDNVNNPGVATITTNTPHGLVPENNVFLDGVPANSLSVAGYTFDNFIANVTTTTVHGLSAGSSILIALGGGQLEPHVVISVITSNSFICAINSSGTGTGTTGTVEYLFPLSTDTQINSSVYEIITCPTATSFQIVFNYTDGTWAGGIASFAWNGKFYITSVPTATSFTYQQSGPNDSSTAVGTLTPFGQAAAGIRTAVCMFRLRSGAITAPSPISTQLVTSGGQYIIVSNVPIGPSNVVARIIAFTGADGSQFYYIGQPAQVNNLVVSSSTVINDNTTVSAVFDFSDNTLFDSTAIDIPGNNLFRLRTLGRPLSVLSYASRAAWFGHADAVQNFLNTRFDGGFTGSLFNPLGWTVATAGGELDVVSAKWGFSWKITGAGAGAAGQLTQSAYADSYGVPILTPSTLYQVDLWAVLMANAGGTSGNLLVDFYSAGGGGVIASATVPVANLKAAGSWFTVNFSASTGITIPADTVLRVYGQDIAVGTIISVDEMEIFPEANPYVRPANFSYVNSPEQLDSLSGELGPTDDDTAIQTWFIYRDSLMFLTQSGLHETSDLAGLEPDSWRVRQVSDHCGACSPRACDSGENFSVWMTSPSTVPPVGRGLYLYTGGAVYKLSQEIQPDFDAINSAAQGCIWVKNDSVTRRIYVGIPTGGFTAPSKVYVLDYRELDTASDLATRSPIHISFSGKMVCSDLSRKWTRWNVFANCAAIMTVPSVGSQFCIGGGNGSIGLTGFSNSYWFDPTLLTDDDYGQITPYYTTYFFVNHEAEQALQVGLHRKLFKRYAIYITGVGELSLTPYANTLSNPWPSPPNWPLSLNQPYDLGDGLNVSTERCAFKIASLPVGGSDNKFFMSKFIITLSQEPVAPLRFGAI